MDRIEQMVNKLEARGFSCVPDDVYRARLDACFTCDALQYGTTCRYCGCIVHVRAKLADEGCPKPGENLW